MAELIKFENYIDGKWVAPAKGQYSTGTNPGNGEETGTAPYSTTEDLNLAVAAAKKAFETSEWSTNSVVRYKALMGWAAELRKIQKDIAEMMVYESGKTFGEAFFEVDRGINYLEFFASIMRGLYGTSTAPDANTMCILAREPVGVVAGIVPWNGPVVLFMRDLAAALAAGNTIVAKPATYTPCCTLMMMRAVESCGLFPDGVINCVAGSGSTIGEDLITHPDVDMIAFTGSAEVGIHIAKAAADTMKKVSLELGGKSPNVIFADADLDRAVPGAISGIFTGTGQVCVAGSRIVVEESIAEEFTKRFVEAAEAIKVGYGMDQETKMGPVTSKKQMEDVLAFIKKGKEEGCKILTGGYRLTGGAYDKGFYIAPTIFTDCPLDADVVQKEIFGPVAVIQTFKTEEEAIAIANGTEFGLASAVWSENLGKAMRVARKMRAGTCWINGYGRLLAECETGGYKMSGVDRAGGEEGLMRFTEVKHIQLNFRK